MKIQQWLYTAREWKNLNAAAHFDPQLAQLVLAFGESSLVTDADQFRFIQERFPAACIVLASTAGEIINADVLDESIVVTAIQFEKTYIRGSTSNINQHNNSFEAGKYLMNTLMSEDLQAAFVISDGKHINGSDLVEGLNSINKANVPVTGGLAGDGARFKKTYVGMNQLPAEGMIAAIGFYGKGLKVGHGSFGGWDEFGPERTITRSEKNILYEIDHKNALDLYKEYLGPYRDELPGSALLFPLSLKEKGSHEPLVRTILSIDEDEKSMLFAGNMPQGSTVRLMKANFDKLIDGSAMAAKNSFTTLVDCDPQLAILISCVGRKLILQCRADEEVEAAREIFGPATPVTGFYSYGEISPFNPDTRCGLHNQTMTITTFSET